MVVRDPVHGDVHLSRLEACVLDLPTVQRLRGIKQLGTAYVVYPGCTHTRFDHSLGACAMAHRILACLRKSGASIPRDLEDLVGASALLHDVTHVPFGHTLEDERRLFPRHDKGTRLARLLEGPLGEDLAQLGIRSEVASLLGGFGTAIPPWARDIVSSTIDADLLDYLRRDSYFSGLAQRYDDRVFHYFVIAEDRLGLNMSKHGMERPDARSEIVQLLRMRYFLTERVYYHHTKVTAGAMISKAVELALEGGVLTEEDLIELNDWTLIDRLLRSKREQIAPLIDHLLRRKLYKRGYVASAHRIPLARRAEMVAQLHESRSRRSQVERELAAELGCSPHHVIVYCPALTVMKEASALVVTPRGLEPLNAVDGTEISEIRALEDRYRGLWRFYVFVPEDHAARTAARAAEIFGFDSEHLAPAMDRTDES